MSKSVTKQEPESASSSSSDSAVATSVPSPICQAFIEELRADLGLKIADECTICHNPVSLHKRVGVSQSPVSESGSSKNSGAISSHVQKSLPIWTAGQQSCHAFIQAFENIMIASNTPRIAWPRSLLFSFPKVVEQNWIKHNIVEPDLEWTDAIKKLVQHFESYNYTHRLQILYENCKQRSKPPEPVQHYGDRFLDTCNQLLVKDDNNMAINHFINGLSLPIRRELQRRIDIARSLNQDLPMDSLRRVVDLAIQIDTSEHGLTAAMNDLSMNNSGKTVTPCIYHPNSTTHSTEQCSKNPSNSQSTQSLQFPSSTPRYSSTSPTVVKSSTPFCWNCKQEGHSTSQCKVIPSSDRTLRSRTSTQLNHIHDNSFPTDDIEEERDVYLESDDNNNNYNNYLANINRMPRLPTREFDRCVKERRCFKCKQPNHLARNCPLWNNKNNTNYNQSKNEQGQRHQ